MSNKELIEKDLEEIAYKQTQEQLKNLELYHFLKEGGYILFETITGSQAHGTNTEKSDIDKAFVYILPEDDILGIRYQEQLKIHKDFMGYEIKRFLELLRKNNPTILELLNSPEDCVLIKHPAFDLLIQERDKFITKICRASFYGYAKQQIVKAKGLDKKQNWEKNRVVRKTPIDFCAVPNGYDSIPFIKWLADRNLDQLFCGISAVDHCRDLFAVFYDYEAHSAFSKLIPEAEREAYRTSKLSEGKTMGLGYKGAAFEDSNDIRRSNIPFEERKNSICHISYNKDGYHKHCLDYKSYQTWLEERNETRWVEIKGHGQQIDGKNLMHCMRLITIGKEIAQGLGVQIRRPDAQELLKIRRGEISLQDLIDKSESLLEEMKALYDASNLPDEVSEDFIHNLLVRIRKNFYLAHATYSSVNLINNETENIFFKQRFGGLSELQFLMKTQIDKEVAEMHNGDINSLLEDYDHAWLNAIPQELWPEENGEPLDTENITILEATRDKVTIIVGGDWQEGLQFDIVFWGDKIVPINIKKVGDWENEITYKDFLTRLGYKI